MKIHLILTLAVLIASGSIAVLGQDEAYVNESAPANYDANLKAGEKAIGVITSSLETINIISKSGSIYKTTIDGWGDTNHFFRANSVYPYFNIEAFGKIVYGNNELIAPYLQCYANKHSLDVEKVKGNGFRDPRFSDAKIMKEELQGQQAKLAQIEAQLKTLTARPDTFLLYENNPAIWYEIALNRAEYLPCALGERQQRDIATSPQLSIHKQDIGKLLKRVNDYVPATKNSMGSSSEYALYAVSPKARSEWLTRTGSLMYKEPLDAALLPLSEALAKKLPAYFPKMQDYPIRNAAEEALMKRALDNSARYKIFKIGLMQSAWQIDKNALGIPNARYKNGVIYLRDTQADHPYCYATYVNIIQDYAGGGTYAASRSRLVLDELAGCPAGQ